MQLEAKEIQEMFSKLEKINLPYEDSQCLDVQCSKNNLLAQLTFNNKILLYNTLTQGVIKLSSQHQVYSCTFSHPNSLNPNQLFIFGESIQIIDLEKYEIVQKYNTEFSYFGDLNIWNEMCVACDKTLVFWDIRQKLAFNCILAHSMSITQCKYNEVGRLITTTAMDNCARIFDSYGTDALVTICGSKKTHATSSTFTKDGKHILLTTLEQPISLWNWIEQEQLASYEINNQSKYFIRPIILYDENDSPMYILQPNDCNQIYQFDFLNPDKEPQIHQQKYIDQIKFRFQYHQEPLRLIYNESSKQFFAFSNNEIFNFQYL